MTDTHADDIHPKHARMKLRMAIRLADKLQEHGGPLANSAALSEAGDVTWERIAEMFGEARVPSPATRAMVCEYLAILEEKEAELVKHLNGHPLVLSGEVRTFGSFGDFMDALVRS